MTDQILNMNGLLDRVCQEKNEREEHRRGYLGASIIGGDCERALWYYFRWWKDETFPGRILRRFRTGADYEKRVTERLEDMGFQVNAVNPNARNDKKQWRAEWGLWGGLLAGSNDGFVRAPENVWRLLEASDPPGSDEWVILEAKAMVSAKYSYPKGSDGTFNYDAYPIANKPSSTKSKIEGRWWKTARRGVKAEQQTHFVQMQTYMGLAREADRSGKIHFVKWGLHHAPNRALYVAINTDLESWHGELVDFRPNWWERIKARAARIFRATTPPERISQNPASWACRFCPYLEACHKLEANDGRAQNVSCRSCEHVELKTPADPDNHSSQALWMCTRHDRGCGDCTACDDYERIIPEETF